MASGPTSRYPDAVHQSISPRLKPGTSGILYASPCGGAYSQYRRFRGGFTCFRLILPQRFARALGRVRVLFREAVAGNAGVLLSSVPKAASLRQLPCGRCLRTSPLVTALGSGANLGGGYLKTECIYRHKPASFCQADEMIDRYIYFCNHERIQLKTGEAPLARRLST